MSFPNRVTRSQLGPRFRDVYPVENPETDIGQKQFNDLFDQTAGMNVIVPRVALVASWNGSAFDVAHQAEAWNSDGGQAHPVLARSGIGRYTYTFAATYLDGDGNAVATSLFAPRITVYDSPTTDSFGSATVPRARAWRAPGSPLVIKVAIFYTTDVSVDAPFWLEVL